MIRMQRFIEDLKQKQWLEVVELPEWQMQRARYIRPGEYEYEQEYAHEQGYAYGQERASEQEGHEEIQHSLNPLNSTHGTTYFLSKRVQIPETWQGEAIGFIFEAGGEGLMKVNGVPYHGLDRNHTFVPLPRERVGISPQLEIELYDPIPEPHDPLNRQAVIQPPIQGIRAALVHVNQPLQSLMYSIMVLSESLQALPEKDLKRTTWVRAVHQVMDEMHHDPGRWQDGVWLHELEQRIAQTVEREDPEQHRSGFMHLVGQSHIDVAWLWPVRETVRKSSRTFSTMCTLMDTYPDFVYSQSQPQLYAFVKEHYPELYERVKARIAEGRWELVGGMWVEPDLNIPSGESLVRQILYGQQFYQSEFGKRSNIEWLPDTFGYCASLPQILRLADIPYFMTTKLNWNDTNVFPYDLFDWVGIDGTSVLSYLNHGVNEHTRPKDVHEHWQSYKQKDVHAEQMLLYGHGDGGGGVTNEMVEFAERSHLMAGQPISQFSTAGAFFEGIAASKPTLPKWHGDLYLELHRGTYTTHARNKRSNRKAEVLYREAEIWSQWDQNHGRMLDRKEVLEEGWKLIMLNQFHDIIPGTSIPEVYVTSAEEYTKVFALGDEVLQGSLDVLTDNIATNEVSGKPYVVFNSLGWERSEVICIAGDTDWDGLAAYDRYGNRLISEVEREEQENRVRLHVLVPSIPAFGYITIWLRETKEEVERYSKEEIAVTVEQGADSALGATGEGDIPVGKRTTNADLEVSSAIPKETKLEQIPACWETEFYLLEFNDLGEITRWYDKTVEREWLRPGDQANEWQFFHDKPTYWDAWDIDPRFESQRAGAVQLISREIAQRGSVQDVLRFRWKLNESEISQDVILFHHQRRVDFKTRVDWNESHKLLKVAFPADLVAAKATYEIPFGALERATHNNTSWERAQFEVCGHRWADLSEGNSGISLLNDCKYGYDIKDRTIRLSLLRAPKWPDVHADQGQHAFTYSVLPHAGDWRQANVVQRAMELNHPVQVIAPTPHGGAKPSEHSWVQFHSEHVILDTIKVSEDGTGTVLRFYESSGGRETVQVQWNERNVSASIINLLEDELAPLTCEGGAFKLTFKPYEIKSVKLVRSS
ncbi:alpha-mannosidase [Paenibacillus polysaccharolyticus]|uniref:alpha-mannosidase n=1 Tax=Paenibacillus polysaccharolyticus TaxID=582692 RepID=UPI00209E060B|nr:alpha-mannosidase [Paenibacillus polysaccharolyticus]MCP1136620.1 alpha-mannosidase [Paenibacillus polysaccharolyticus]